jgi:hypothetical protein
MKEPEERMSLHEVMQHPWVTCRGTAPLPTVAASGLQVSLRPAYVVPANGSSIQLFWLMWSQESLSFLCKTAESTHDSPRSLMLFDLTS